jgi:hypothetical protein
MRQNPPVEKVVLVMAMAPGDGVVENDRLIIMVFFVTGTVRKIRSGSGAVKTLYDQHAFQESKLLRIIRAAMIEAAPNPVKEKICSAFCAHARRKSN